ncbi:pyruvate kinase [Aquiflexum sp. TKW24L]|uniref:pyruvate kinase n=1 Tax=Aquiflexum sp. TKW24L TaxID=2942212 RepID=UPI0020C0C8B0|nr:pyruvate kinase [Aquiflexum sp. TKW24L]MCL6259001.1 pyruvate kinase [Aquiflexum sp. TKW24L]
MTGSESLEFIKNELISLEKSMAADVVHKSGIIASLHKDQKEAAKNMVEYLSVRNRDLRVLQDALHVHGLSSLASSESHVRRQVQAILERLGETIPVENIDICDFSFSKKKIDEKSHLLFGNKTIPSIPSLMVTFDSGFADSYAVIKSLLENGMNVARINCAHDDEATWSKMINKLRKASKQTGIDCKIYMDMAGPKIRTVLLGKGKDKGKVQVKEGDLIWMAEDGKGFAKDDIVISPNVPGIISFLKKGNRVYIDDGVIRAIVEKTKSDKAGIRITRISSEKSRIKAEKGINFPDTMIEIPSLTDFDKACLPFICENADLVGYSFVRTALDISNLQSELKAISDNPPHVILKIETPEAVSNLPSLLIEGMKQRAFGVMIARGDLAVEIGFERMGEIQEEILWICEAAHVPVVWATQVLESLNKSGMATRSEITDAGQAANAECVMVNKGDHTIEVMETLKDILQRSAEHRVKKRFRFRQLKIAERFLNS